MPVQTRRPHGRQCFAKSGPEQGQGETDPPRVEPQIPPTCSLPQPLLSLSRNIKH